MLGRAHYEVLQNGDGFDRSIVVLANLEAPDKPGPFSFRFRCFPEGKTGRNGGLCREEYSSATAPPSLAAAGAEVFFQHHVRDRFTWSFR